MIAGVAGSAVARAMVEIAADDNPLMNSLAALSSKLTTPLTGASRVIKDTFTRMFQGVGSSMTSILSGDIAGGIDQINHMFTDVLSGGIRAASRELGDFTNGIGDLLDKVPLIGPLLGAPFHMLADLIPFVGSLVGDLVSKLGELFRISSHVAKAIDSEDAWTRFELVLGAAGEKVGFTSKQLKEMAEQLEDMGKFNLSEIREAMTGMFKFGDVRGSVFESAMKAAMGLADVLKTDLTAAVNMVGMALDSPERGFMRLRRAFGAGFVDDLKKQLEGITDKSEAQAIILDAINRKVRGVAEGMGATTKDLIDDIGVLWGKFSTQIGKIFLPMVKEVATAVFDMLQGVKGWIKDNAETWKEWAGILQGIGANVVGMLKEGFANLFDVESAQSFWEGFRDGVTEVLSTLEALTGNWDTFKNAAEVAWLTIRNAALDFFDTVKSKLSDIAFGIKGMFLSVITDVLGTLSASGGIATELFTTPFNAALDAHYKHTKEAADRRKAAMGEPTISEEKRARDTELSEKSKSLTDTLEEAMMNAWTKRMRAEELAGGKAPFEGGDLGDLDGKKAKGLEMVGIAELSKSIQKDIGGKDADLKKALERGNDIGEEGNDLLAKLVDNAGNGAVAVFG